ncbi:nuclear transport factor 2 family protein [Sphingomonas cannabina]|uniref:nuclear transport factor 2 family protein n=1 Tax=Sphingomonas cannabina TaxID=2899123 RepID=UPI001F2A4E48|nr:nuclear transport factor 2 family protein [Sphingomonas cannabina]UIJ46297.1 nuclear transport factor 2 family protein [Sphingomonas cannabina]
MAKMIKTAAAAFAATIAACTLVLAPGHANAQQASETERNRALVARGMEAWADGTGSPYDLLADDARWTITGNALAAKTYPSKEAFLAEVIRPFNARMRDRLIPSVHRYYAEGDTVIVHFDARGTARDGKPYVNSYAWILRMHDGKIVEAHAFFDAIAFDDLWKRVSPAPRP